MSELRRIAAIPVPGVDPNEIAADRPGFEWVDPKTLFVEESYQRDLGEKSVRLIRRIVARWDWKAMKPPICARLPDGRMMVIDGQHTAIAAATHPGIEQIPVMIVAAAGVADRADAFVRHNSDRIAMTTMQLFHAQLATGDEVAVAVRRAAELAGVRILRNPQSGGIYKPGDTVGVVTLCNIAKSRGERFLVRVLKILVDAKRAPVGSTEMKAVALLLTEPEWKDAVDAEDLAVLIRSKSTKDWLAHAETHVRKGMNIPTARALAIDWYKMVPKRRRAAA